jgi:hypothetical protein
MFTSTIAKQCHYLLTEIIWEIIGERFSVIPEKAIKYGSLP